MMGKLRVLFSVPRWILALCGVLLLLVVPLFAGTYVVYVLNLAGIYIIVSLGLNLLTGYAGQISLGHAAFFALGAYGSTILMTRLGLPFWLSVPVSALLCGIIGLAVGVPALRLRGLYLAIATMGFGMVVSNVLLQMKDLTGAGEGLRVPRATIGDFVFDSDQRYYYIVVFAVFAFIVMTRNITSTRAGRAFLSIRESDIAAQTMGVNISLYKVLAFAVSAFYAAIAGGLYAHLIGYINIFDFDLVMSISFLTMIVIGGMGSILGSVVGAVFLTVLPEMLRGLRDVQVLVYGILTIVVMLYFPYGIGGIIHRLANRLAAKPGQPAKFSGGTAGSLPNADRKGEKGQVLTPDPVGDSLR